ncbi:MAG: hypothetical protein H0T92_02435 [Pyrinomonadaceae bacterium]|nr:hypothetical protein [Pyrinomonadaceae bacterium]
MKPSVYAKSFAAFAVIICLLVAPVPVLAKKGDKNFKRGEQYEAPQQWERAAQEYALAVAADPKRVEFQLHYRRALFNASQMFMERGRTLAEQRDYTGAYNNFRQAYGYDPVNELAQSEMERMLRLQREKEGIVGDDNGARDGGSTAGKGGSPAGARITPTSYQEGAGNGAPRGAQQGDLLPARGEHVHSVIRYDDLELETVIRNLAEQLDLNIVFDNQFPKRKISINWKGLTAARALDNIFLSNNLFFQKLDRRTILVADQNKRPTYQQLVLRTFYLSNIVPDKAQKLIQTAIPPSPGRGQTIVVANDTTNSITVRDTPENVRLIGDLIRSVDKDRAEVVMDVSIYEVSRTDLMQLGNQVGSNFGGTSGLNILGGSRDVAQRVGGAIPTALGAALLIPSSTLTALQSRDRTNLVARTQLRAFDNEQSVGRIGKKIPIQTATVPNYGFSGQNNNNQGSGTANPGAFGNYGYPVIQYQDTGLIFKFKPQVFPNLDVQVTMEIESSDASVSGSTDNLTPVISQRTITGTTRIPNNRTTMVASVAQNQEIRGRQGLPLLGLIPVLGRLFTAPKRNDVQTDIVIMVTPHVLRAPSVTPRDEEMRPSGTLQTPTTESLASLVQEADREDQLAAARRIPTNVSIQLPNLEVPPAYVPAPKIMMGAANASGINSAATTNALNTGAAFAPPGLLPISSAVLATSVSATTIAKELLNPSSAASSTTKETAKSSAANATSKPASVAELHLLSQQQMMRIGEKRSLMVTLKTDAPLSMAVAKLRFNPHVVAIRSVAKGNLFADTKSEPMITHAVDQKGGLLLSIAPGAGAAPMLGAGVLFVIEVEAVGVGESELSFGTDNVHFLTSDGRNISPQLSHSYLAVKQ